MSERIHPITDHKAGEVHAYLLDMDDGLTLIDTLSDDAGTVVIEAIEEGLKRPLTDLKRIVLTHAHRSHIRGARRLKELVPDATVYANPFEAATIGGLRPCAPVTVWPHAPRQALKLQYGLSIGVYLERIGVPRDRLGRFNAPACDVDEEVVDGDTIGELQVVLTPGHTDGSTSFYWPREKALFTGDVVVTWPRLEIGWRGLNVDTARNRRSLGELATVGEVEFVGSGHGPPIVDDAAASVRALLTGAAVRGPYSSEA
jgi:glyoxylase-like metal-dependent hydrolase (beta-lactamase superfamily II)